MKTNLMAIRKLNFFVFLLTTVIPLHAHIEPPKSAAERAAQQAQQARYREAGVTKAIAWQADASGNERILAEWTYDLNGRESSMVLHDPKNGSKTYITQTYDPRGNLVLDADRDENGRIIEMNALEYNDVNLITKIISYDSSLSISGILEYTYLTDTVLATKYKAGFSRQYTIHYTYENGKNTGAIQRDDAGGLIIRTENRFGYDGLRTAKEVYKADGQLDYYFTYNYDDSGNFKRIEKRGPDKTLQRVDEYIYNAKGLPETITVSDGSGRLISKRRYQYTYLDE